MLAAGYSSARRPQVGPWSMRWTMRRHLLALCGLLLVFWRPGSVPSALPPSAGEGARPRPKGKAVMRVAAAQPRNRTIDFRLKPADVLAQVDRSLGELEEIVHKAGAAGCDALALPEDTLGLLKWEVANPKRLKEVLPEAVKRMLSRLGKAAARHNLYLVVCNDTVEADGTTRNTAFLLGRDGKEIGRYHKVNLPLPE